MRRPHPNRGEEFEEYAKWVEKYHIDPVIITLHETGYMCQNYPMSAPGDDESGPCPCRNCTNKWSEYYKAGTVVGRMMKARKVCGDG